MGPHKQCRSLLSGIVGFTSSFSFMVNLSDDYIMHNVRGILVMKFFKMVELSRIDFIIQFITYNALLF